MARRKAGFKEKSICSKACWQWRVLKPRIMALVLRTIYNSYNFYFYSEIGRDDQSLAVPPPRPSSLSFNFFVSTDPRSVDWFLLETPPTSITLILIGYVILIKHGPSLMESREAFDLKHIMMIYNLFQVVSNTFLGLYVSLFRISTWQSSSCTRSRFSWFHPQGGYFFFYQHGFDFKCQECDYSPNERGLMELKLTYFYFLLKVLDLLDTVIWLMTCVDGWKRKKLFTHSQKLFIVLKKKSSHLSFLHCYHHSFMVVGTYAGVRWVPGGHGLLLGFLNVFVHAFMYFYYFLTAVRPEVKQSIWWKRHITQFQLVRRRIFHGQRQQIAFHRQFSSSQLQFAVLTVAFMRACFTVNCGYPKFWLWVMVIQNTFMFALFADFYRKAYFKKSEAQKSQ